MRNPLIKSESSIIPCILVAFIVMLTIRTYTSEWEIHVIESFSHQNCENDIMSGYGSRYRPIYTSKLYYNTDKGLGVIITYGSHLEKPCEAIKKYLNGTKLNCLMGYGEPSSCKLYDNE